LLEDGAILLLVRVHDIWGLGGTVGPPAISLALAPKDTSWSFHRSKSRLPGAGPW
jgi:hypothetical protein